jgi:hypothetical protein
MHPTSEYLCLHLDKISRPDQGTHTATHSMGTGLLIQVKQLVN